MKEIEQVRNLLASNLTDAKLAEIAGMTQQAISKYRNGLSKVENMRFEQALKLVKFKEEMKMLTLKELVNNWNIELKDHVADFEWLLDDDKTKPKKELFAIKNDGQVELVRCNREYNDQGEFAGYYKITDGTAITHYGQTASVNILDLKLSPESWEVLNEAK